ncbi:hypothetical protein LCGC14_2758940, partial [marine sediment metagenome]
MAKKEPKSLRKAAFLAYWEA